jgi:hypothetical protein
MTAIERIRKWQHGRPDGRRMIAEAAFDRIEALGLDLDVTPSIEADQYGWAEVFGPNPLIVPLSSSIGQCGRGERI